ncbi:ABC transporter substrate-binding protein [Paenibacillus vini]|uniref:ABC transporter substrate-binding protein n=1 Tax=Paenibacillus vini TaxID=1476024 RepID=A0ABQ4M694_9BACL|nr:ABC transporter substrate-binding protein [Paenibacillus vini]MDN4066364.1 ABC transporter substrate-binding protein [Paenibacillus vini]GIP51523.1 ABC transporter substrate-binding protein [Paenibacillus vini]
MRQKHRLSRITLTLALVAIFVIITACGGRSTASSGPDTAVPAKAAGNTKELIIAEPVHSTGYLPLYIAIRKGLFEDIDVKVVTLSGGSAHTNAVLTDQAFGFIGGPEHNAFAKAKGAELRAVVNIVNRGNVYLVARSGLDPGTDIAAFMRGKSVAVTQYGGTPNSIIRYLAKEWGYELDKDITLKEVDSGAIPAILQQGQGDVAVVTEPILTQGIQEGIWGEPFYNVPQELGPYAYSTINIKQDSITKDPETVQKFVTGIQKGLEFLQDNHEESMEIAKQEFPTMAEDLLKTTLNRSYEDEMWEFSGQISEEAVTTGLAVVRAAGLLKTDTIEYADIIDMQFVK